ncbi:MAG: hypothetical protein LBL62_11435 [Planctomycetaceae bacterium]|nr:hypothetical protein [Planctomycetaceae bacterium]
MEKDRPQRVKSACDTIHSPLICCPYRAIVYVAVTHRVAAGWLVLPFQGGGKLGILTTICASSIGYRGHFYIYSLLNRTLLWATPQVVEYK